MVRTGHNASSAELIGHIYGFFLGEAVNDASVGWVVGFDEFDHIINYVLCPIRFWSNRVLEIVAVGCTAKELIVGTNAQNSGTIVPNTLGGGGSHSDERNMRKVCLENS